jgi:hypothetical protein
LYRSLLHRFTTGVLIGTAIWGIGLLVSFVLTPFMGNNTFGTTFLHDLPGIALIFGLVLAFDIWGFLPRPEEDTEEKEKQQETGENATSSS